MTETTEQGAARLQMETAFAATHECLGCTTCWFADKDKIGKEPCCTHIKVQFSDDGGECLSHRKTE